VGRVIKLFGIIGIAAFLQKDMMNHFQNVHEDFELLHRRLSIVFY